MSSPVTAAATPSRTDASAPGRRGVLDAAAELFVTQGYDGTTLRQIADAAGIKAGSVYHHFDSKEALFLAVMADGIAVMNEAFAQAAESTMDDADVTERLGVHVRAHLGAIFENGPYTTAHVTAFFIAPASIRARIVPARDHYERAWTGLLADLFPAATSSDRRLHRLRLFGTMNSTAEWFDPDGDVSLDHLADHITHHFLNGMPT